MNRNKLKIPLMGAEPKISFLPPQIGQKYEVRRLASKVAVAVVIGIAVSVLAYLGAQSLWIASNTKLTEAQSENERVISLQKRYSAVVSLYNESIELGAAAVVVSDKQVDWGVYSELAYADLPRGGAINSMQFTAPSAMESLTNFDELDGQPIAVTLEIVFQSPTYKGVEMFLRSAQRWPGYVSGSLEELHSAGGGFDAVVNIDCGLSALLVPSERTMSLEGVEQ
jgi:hypothetical protein